MQKAIKLLTNINVTYYKIHIRLLLTSSQFEQAYIF